MTSVKQSVVAAVERNQLRFWRISDAIWHFAEIGFQEYRSSQALARVLEEAGFRVEMGVGGMPTAFTAVWSSGSGKPVLGLPVEYDALPGLSQKGLSTSPDPLVAGAPGHGCGHNSMAAMQVLAAVALKEAMEGGGLNGTLKLFGSPAEEILASRPFMVRAGLFEGLDAAIDCHASESFEAVHGTQGTALFSLRATFLGKTSHAGFDPWRGRSAADAVELMHAGTERMREHVPPTTRVHWITTYCGEAPNVVPEKASTWYLVRDKEENLEEVAYWVKSCAEAAAMMTQTRLRLDVLTACHQCHYNATLAKALFKNMEQVGKPSYSAEEERFAGELQRCAGLKEVGLQYDVKLFDAAMGPMNGGSSDVGDLCLTVPTGCIKFPGWIPGSPVHNWTVVSAGLSSIAHKGISAGAKVAALTLFDLFAGPEILKEAKKEFDELKSRSPYRAFLARDAEPPVDFYKGVQEKYRDALEAEQNSTPSLT